MNVPMSAADDVKVETEIPKFGSEYIHNKYFGKEMLTPIEALDLINMLAAEMMADGCFRSGS
jgi:hypothetical protein